MIGQRYDISIRKKRKTAGRIIIQQAKRLDVLKKASEKDVFLAVFADFHESNGGKKTLNILTIQILLIFAEEIKRPKHLSFSDA